MVQPFLADRALLITTRSHWSGVAQANLDFRATHPHCQLLLDLTTAADSEFWQGLQVLSWDTTQSHEVNWDDLEAQQHQDFIDQMQGIQSQENQRIIEQLFAAAVAAHTAEAWTTAERNYRMVLDLAPKHADAWHNLGMVLYATHRYPVALQSLLRAIALLPAVANYHYSLGLVMEAVGDGEQAIHAYQQTITLDPHHPHVFSVLGKLLRRQGQTTEAEAIYRQDIICNPARSQPYVNLLTYLYEQNREQAAADLLASVLASVSDPDIINHLAYTLTYLGCVDAAIATAAVGLELQPENLYLRMIQRLMLPILYKTEADIQWYRQHYQSGLEDLIRYTQNLDHPQVALAGIASDPYLSFYLAAQAQNDRDLQRLYGQFVQEIMAANYPDWIQPLSLAPLKPGEKIRIGYVSAFMRQHTVGKLFLGWLQYHDVKSYEIYSYYIRRDVDATTQEFQAYSDLFHQIPEDLEAACRQIIADQLHILVFLEIGMEAQTTQMAALRLAPIQCMAWGHPVTSGLTTVDYFLTSQNMESETASEHYTESLVYLPNISIAYRQPRLPEQRKSRDYFALPGSATLYLSCQSIHKYLPQYDWLFAAIASQVPQAKFVFIAARYPHLTQLLKTRLDQAFQAYELDYGEYCFFLPQLTIDDYLSLNLVSDIFLDTLGWSGGNTTLEAIAGQLPIVTCPGELMRSRHAAGILKLLEVTETIAANETEYIKIAVRLGLDPAWRQTIVSQMQAGLGWLYEDRTCVQALETFYQRVISQGLTSGSILSLEAG
ncbi:tetratricopeptide repeat protein [Neosynechococcus sphagnicola]|uniref:O-linked N-acetylglucosamine transferase, SPINDLY family protein n=1 Tax=Neosynechococcus sphagnicola TaxID=1501145 RepID=UPI000A424FF4|nr:tetratricopeptide repeat protein [Neosynechococcus sphagnicola]